MRESPVRDLVYPPAPEPRRLVLLVEAPFDGQILLALLRKAGYPTERLDWVVAGGREEMKRMLAEASAPFLRDARCAAVVGGERAHVPDAVKAARQELGDPPVTVFSAVPAVEAWLLADADAVGKALKAAADEGFIDTLFGARGGNAEPHSDGSSVERALLVVDHMDVALASTRSPSLHAFLRGMGELMDVDTSFLDRAQARGLARETLSNLLAEVSPADTVIYRTMDGHQITAREMIQHMDSGTDLGRQFASDLLRISRDFLARKAQRESRA
jgi:hypothetical protein